MAIEFEQLPLSIALEVSATLDNFYLSTPNKATVMAFRHFLDQPMDTLFYLWGGHSSGVSHLLKSVDHTLGRLSVYYLPLKSQLHQGVIDIDELDGYDLVCLDDIEVVGGHPVWEEILFHFFNRMRDSGKRIVIGAHMPPRQLPLALPDLKSRLQWGCVFHLHALDDDAKQEAIQSRATELGFILPDDVARYILFRTGRSLSQLYGVLDVLDRASLAEQKKLTVPFVKKVLGL